MDYNKLLEIANIIKSSNNKKQIDAHHIQNALQIMSLYNPELGSYKTLKNCNKIIDEFEKTEKLPNNYFIVKSHIETINTQKYVLTLHALLYICGLYI